jgi:hypothetical protein
MNQSRYGYSIPTKSPTKYLFELRLGLNDGSYISIRKIDENRYTNLINNDDNINYENIVSYSIHISEIPDNVEKTFSNSGYLSTYMSFFSNQDNNVYIEFNRLNNGKATCTCRYVDYNNLGLSISPPF